MAQPRTYCSQFSGVGAHNIHLEYADGTHDAVNVMIIDKHVFTVGGVYLDLGEIARVTGRQLEYRVYCDDWVIYIPYNRPGIHRQAGVSRASFRECITPSKRGKYEVEDDDTVTAMQYAPSPYSSITNQQYHFLTHYEHVHASRGSYVPLGLMMGETDVIFNKYAYQQVKYQMYLDETRTQPTTIPVLDLERVTQCWSNMNKLGTHLLSILAAEPEVNKPHTKYILHFVAQRHVLLHKVYLHEQWYQSIRTPVERRSPRK